MIVALAIPPPSHIVCSTYRPPRCSKRVDERRHDAGTAAAERVTDGDCTAVDVFVRSSVRFCSISTSFAQASTTGSWRGR